MNVVADAQIQHHRLTVEAYHRMGEAGILGEDARVELIEGELIDRTPHRKPTGRDRFGCRPAYRHFVAQSLHWGYDSTTSSAYLGLVGHIS
jgi:hypothetical protein